MNIVSQKVGVVLALATSLLVAQVLRHYYHWDESLAYNIFLSMNGFLFPFPSMDQTLEEQVAHFVKITTNMEGQATEFNAKFMGDVVYQASFGEKQTQVHELTVPSSTTKSYDIPVLCSAPSRGGGSSSPQSLPVILYYFGGGLVLGSPKGELLMIRWVANEANAIVCAVEYRKAPGYSYPIPVQDALEGAIGVLTTQANQIETAFDVKMDRNRVGTYGVSAGVYMAGHVARRLTELQYRLRCQVMLVPMIKPNGGTYSAVRHWDQVWGGMKNSYAWVSYLPRDDGKN